jgi:hypothetical protein
VADLEDTQVIPAPKPDNLMQQLRAKREEASRNVLLELPVPGYDDLLVVRFQKTLTWLEAKKMIEVSQRKGNPNNELFAIADLLIKTVEGIYGRADPEGEFTLISHGFDEKLSEYFELDTKTARETCRLFFGSDITMSAVQGRVITWLQGIDFDSGEEIRGN